MEFIKDQLLEDWHMLIPTLLGGAFIALLGLSIFGSVKVLKYVLKTIGERL